MLHLCVCIGLYQVEAKIYAKNLQIVKTNLNIIISTLLLKQDSKRFICSIKSLYNKKKNQFLMAYNKRVLWIPSCILFSTN